MSSVSLTSWVVSQRQSSLHMAAVGLFGLMIFLAYQSPVGLVVGYIGFFLVTSLSKVWKMLIFMAVIGIVLAVLPFLAPVAIILMIVLFFMRIGYVIQNWKPVVAGLAVYGFAFPLSQLTMNYHYWGVGLFEPLLASALGAFGLHFILMMLYKEGYSSKTALGIMGSVPLVILGFVLPFLKLHIPVADTVMFEGAPVEGTHVGQSATSNVVHHNPIVEKPVAETVIPRPQSFPVSESVSVKTTPALGSYQPNHVPLQAQNQLHLPQTAQVHQAVQGNEVYHVQDNVFGGKEISDSHGQKIISTRDNVFDGEDIFTPEGKRIATTQANIFNGQDIYDANNSRIATTQENVFGGEDIYNQDNQKIASTRDNGIGGKDIYDQNGSKIGSIE